MTNHHLFWGLIWCAVRCSGSLPDDADVAIGFIVSAQNGDVIAAGSNTPLPATPGTLLFPGDKLVADLGTGTIAFDLCPPDGSGAKRSYTLHSSIRLTKSLPINAPPGLQGVPLMVCEMPTIARAVEVATIPALDAMLPSSAGQALDSSIAEAAEPARSELNRLAVMDRSDPCALMSFAAALQRNHLPDFAAQQYAILVRQWKYEPRWRRLIWELVSSRSGSREVIHAASEATGTMAGGGRLRAVVVGISSYEQKKVPNLRFAGNDARTFAEYLATARGGNAKTQVLVDKQATTGAIRNSLIDLVSKSAKNDILVLLIAAHGFMKDGRIPSVLTHRTDPEDEALTSIPLTEIQSWMLGRKPPAARAMVFLDLCHAGYAAQFQTEKSGAAPPGNALTLLATQPSSTALAFENSIFDKGHGAFTYFVLRGLNTGEARSSIGNFVSAGSLASYVQSSVAYVTDQVQLPVVLIGLDSDTNIADLNAPGISGFDSTPLASLRLDPKMLRASKGGRGKTAVAFFDTPPESIAPDFAARVDLEDEGEAILLRYLKGDEIPQTLDEFQKCARLYREALALQPGSPYLEARYLFCEGRAATLAHSYPDAIRTLSESVQLDPNAAFSYNALGIADLEQNHFALAASCFRDAIERAPKWVYPRHNLALTLAQAGEFQLAEQAYNDALRLGPDYFYVHYSLGELYQRANRLDDARRMYREAARLAPSRAEPLNGLGSIELLRNHDRQATLLFRQALAQPDQLPLAIIAARHNLALVLKRDRATVPEALQLLRTNEGYIPSQLELAESLSNAARAAKFQDAGHNQAAMDAYENLVKLAPDGLAARKGYAELLDAASQPAMALRQYEQILKIVPADERALERRLRILLSLNRRTEACAQVVSVLGASTDRRFRADIKRVERECQVPAK